MIRRRWTRFLRAMLLIGTLVSASSGLSADVTEIRSVESGFGKSFFKGVSYGPFRNGQAPGGLQPSVPELREDLHLIAEHWEAIRVYGSDPFARQICQIIRDDDLGLKVMVGAWIDKPEAEVANTRQVDQAIDIANEFPDVVAAVSVGNEALVFWSFHKAEADTLIKYVRDVRSKTKVPVTVADDFLFWTDPESKRVADEVDFIVTHIYAMWHAQQLENAITFSEEKLQAVQNAHPEKQVVLGEIGWATAKSASGEQADRLRGVAGEKPQAEFYQQFREWIERTRTSTFYFSAFDEKWKGGPDPSDAEKNWGLFRSDRTPKLAIEAIIQEKARDTRSGTTD